MKAVCVKCGRELRCEKNEVQAEQFGTDGKTDRLWSADLWKCPSCGYLVILGFGYRPLKESWEKGYNESLKKDRYEFRIG